MTAPDPKHDSVHAVIEYLVDKVHYLLDLVDGNAEEPVDAGPAFQDQDNSDNASNA